MFELEKGERDKEKKKEIKLQDVYKMKCVLSTCFNFASPFVKLKVKNIYFPVVCLH